MRDVYAWLDPFELEAQTVRLRREASEAREQGARQALEPLRKYVGGELREIGQRMAHELARSSDLRPVLERVARQAVAELEAASLVSCAMSYESEAMTYSFETIRPVRVNFAVRTR